MITVENVKPDKGAALKPPPVGAAFLVSQVGAHAALAFGERLSALDLKPHHAGILRMLGTNPGLTQQALSELLGVFPSQLVRFLDLLQEQQLIERRDAPNDRRSYRLHLTRKGRSTLARIGELTQELERDFFAALSAEETHLLQELLARVVAQQRITPGVHPAYKQL
jgi:DNA-binding MarR family transcriptional regulator